MNEQQPEGTGIPMSIAQQLVWQTVLLTTDNWFFAPNGRMYRGVFGTLRGVHTAEATLGIRPNGKSTNWYLEIGCMVIAGCQIHYALRCADFNSREALEVQFSPADGLKTFDRPCQIFNADAEETTS